MSGTAAREPADAPIWTPSRERAAAANLARFAARYAPDLLPADGRSIAAALWPWSIAEPEAFWSAVWEFCGVIGEAGRPDPDEADRGHDEAPLPWRTPFFPGARLNYAENLLRVRDDREALVAWSERGRERSLTYAELVREVARYQTALRAAGVVAGDRVAGYLPNVPETVVAALATASLGAIWSSTSPDFGERAVLDRFGQIAPKVLFATRSALYAGKRIDLRARLAAIAAALPDLARIVVVPNPAADDGIAGLDPSSDDAAIDDPRAVWLDDWLDGADRERTASTPTFRRVPFDHPLYVVYSSGTTGLPKGIVHGHGGTLVQHLKELVLHTDLRRDDRIFYFTTCGWMMWNWLLSSLAVGATVVLYDGAPMAPEKDALWRMAAAERITIFGTSAKFLALCEKEGLAPGRAHDLSALRTVLSTGSPLLPESFDWVYREIVPDVHLASISGGTDLLSCFALGDPTAPVDRGELQTRGLGMAVEIWNERGESIVGAAGELVCTRPFPSMPVAFWHDPDGRRYRAAYFEHFERPVWRHGDWARLVDHGGGRFGVVVSGRSDATLNPGGVRIGTAEIYRQVERLPEILESVAIGQEWQGDVRIVLFVRLRDGIALDDELRERIRREIRAHASPHHVPRRIVAVADLPRTQNGKLSELAVHAAVHGRALGNREALANPEALALVSDLPELST